MNKSIAVFLVFFMSVVLRGLIGCGNSEKSIPLPGKKGTGIGGTMAFDGKCFWGTRVPLSFKREAKKEIVKFDTFGEVIKTFTSKENFSDLTFDGKNIFFADGERHRLFALKK